MSYPLAITQVLNTKKIDLNIRPLNITINYYYTKYRLNKRK